MRTKQVQKTKGRKRKERERKREDRERKEEKVVHLKG